MTMTTEINMNCIEGNVQKVEALINAGRILLEEIPAARIILENEIEECHSILNNRESGWVDVLNARLRKAKMRHLLRQIR